jgi:DNA-binding protein YbaB
VTRIEVGITHEVTIKGDKSWVRLAISDDVSEGMDVNTHIDLLAEQVNKKLIEIIEQTVETVSNYQ